MSTITTKQLRENMPQVIRDLGQGKFIQLSYRHKVIGVLQPVENPYRSLRRGSSESIKNGLEALYDLSIPKSIRADERDVKEQIAEIRQRKYE